jgi:hypothetical protein
MAAGSRLAASFSRDRAMQAKAALEVPVADLEAELRRLILAAQARLDCREADRAVPAGQPSHFEGRVEAGADREDAALRRKA